jgi:tyrosinase
MTVNLGPVVPTIINVPPNPQPDGLGHNPRCLRRDVNRYSAAVTKTNYTYDLITNPANADIGSFQTVMQGQFDLGKWGVHAGGHFTIGGDPGGVCFSLFLYPSIPTFSKHIPLTPTIRISTPHPGTPHSISTTE